MQRLKRRAVIETRLMRRSLSPPSTNSSSIASSYHAVAVQQFMIWCMCDLD